MKTSQMIAWFAWRLREAIESEPGPKYCDRCGSPNDASASYCVGCGQALNY